MHVFLHCTKAFVKAMGNRRGGPKNVLSPALIDKVVETLPIMIRLPFFSGDEPEAQARGLQPFRFRIARLLSVLGLCLAILVLVPTLAVDLREGKVHLAVVEILAVVFLLILSAAGRRLGVLRSAGLLAVAFVLGTVLFFESGIHGPGEVWLASAIFLSAVLFGSSGVAVMASATGFVFAVAIVCQGLGYLPGRGSRLELEVAGLNTVGLALATSLAASRLVSHLSAATQARDRLDGELRARDKYLEEESAGRRGAEAMAAFFRDHDGLTHLPNREGLARELAQALKRASRHGGSLAVLALGFDRLGKVIETRGRMAAETLLVELAAAVRAGFRDEDCVARLGDETFGIICGDLRRTEDVIELVTQVKACVERSFEVAGASLHITPMIGVALYPNDAVVPEDLLHAAESALHSARKAGPGAFRLFDPSLQKDSLERLRLEEELETAIFSGAIEAWFQPKVDHAGRIVGAEALARWRLPNGALRLPADFIHVAEGSGGIAALGVVMLARACEEAASWERKGLGRITVSVNLSPFQFSNPDLVGSVRRALEVSGLCPSSLELEITETGLASFEEGARERLAELRSLGVGLSIDDFGTGSSSISRLRDYPVNAVKVPKDFVDPLPGDAKAMMIARAVIDLAHNLDFQVIAEGVEDREQFDWLKGASCDQYQGYLFAPALCAADFESALAKSNAGG